MFHVGQRVVCVDASGFHTPLAPRQPQLNSIYVVAGIDRNNLLIDQMPNPIYGCDDIGWRASRFRPVVEPKTDISIFRDLLNPSPEKVKEFEPEDA